jgi:hypothetical protein
MSVNEEKYIPKFERVAEIPIVLHVGIGGKKSHLSHAEVRKSVDTGEMCWRPFASRCGSAKWSHQHGRSSESVMQYAGTAHITCKKCGEQDVTLNPQGFDLDNMRSFDVVFDELRIKKLRDALNPEDSSKFDTICEAMQKFNKNGGMRPNIKIGDNKAYRNYNYNTGDYDYSSPMYLITAIHEGKKIIYEYWNSEKQEHIKIEIN